jgi:preprotein translocase subunit SecE
MGGVLTVTVSSWSEIPAPKESFVAKNEGKAVAVKRPNRIKKYFQETVGELRKVTWPTRKEATNLTLIVLVVTLTMGLFLGLLDYLFSRFFVLLFA